MKKLAAFLLVGIILMLASFAHGAGTNAITSVTPYANGVTHVLITWTADSSDHTTPDLTLSGYRGQYLCQMWTNPSSTAPTDDYDITLNYDGGDLLKGGGLNRDTANTEVTYPVITATYQGGCVYVPGDLVVNIANNSVNSAGGTILLIFSQYPMMM